MAEEAAFLEIGQGAVEWLTKAAAVGASRVRRKMAEAIDLAKLHGAKAVDEALGVAAAAGRFGDGDLASILAHHRSAEVIELPSRAQRRSVARSLQRSTCRLAGVRAMTRAIRARPRPTRP